MSKKENIPRTFLLGEIVENVSNEMIEKIYHINELDKNKPITQRIPIEMIINSQGGDVYPGLGIIDTMVLSKTPINTTCLGHAMSMAFVILCAGKTRKISKNSTLMYHEMWYSLYNTALKMHKEETIEGERIQGIIDNIIVSRTSVSLKKLRKFREEGKQWYIIPEIALKFKIVDEII